MGGCRLWSYETDEGAVTDVLRLSRGMSYKNALANLPAGGGKAVILGPMPWVRREAQFKALGRAIDELGGRYVTAEDVGVKVSDMKAVASQTNFVSGIEAKKGGIGGDPSPFTARGVLRGIEAAAQRVWGRSDLEGLKVAVQGLGGVGRHHRIAPPGQDALAAVVVRGGGGVGHRADSFGWVSSI